MIMEKKKILFVCVENSNRSQMSQAFAKIHGGEKVEAYSAGSAPSGKINPKAISAMQELGYDLSVHASKSLKEVEAYAPYDAVVTMGCGDACPWMPCQAVYRLADSRSPAYGTRCIQNSKGSYRGEGCRFIKRNRCYS
jgi:protein-tyrosine-phosphatase